MATSDEESVPMSSSVVRYSLRTMLVVLGITAFVAAIAGYYYRQRSPAAQTYLLLLWSSLILALGWYYWSYERKRLELKARAGKCLVSLPSVHNHFWASASVVNWGGIFLFCYAFYLLFNNTYYCEQIAERDGVYGKALMYGLIISLHFVMGFFLLLAGGGVQLCENGILWKQSFIPWKEISRITRNLGVKRDDRTVYSLKGNPMFRVPEQLCEQVDTLIAQKLSRKD